MLPSTANIASRLCALSAAAIVGGCSSGPLPVGALGAGADGGIEAAPSPSSTATGGADAGSGPRVTSDASTGAQDSGHQDATKPPDSAGAGDAGGDTTPPTPIFDGGACTPAEEAKRWALMVREPVVPPISTAGLDLSSWLTGPGLTVQKAEEVNCQCVALGDVLGEPGVTTCAWGANQEVLLTYFTNNDSAWMLYLSNGYTGGLGCNGLEPGDAPSGPCQPLKSRNGAHTYFIPIGSQVQKDNTNFEIDWLDPVAGVAELNELGDALLATYAPQRPADATCLSDGTCTLGAFGDVPYFGVVPLGIYISAASQSASQPVPSIMTNFQIYSPTDPTDGGFPHL